MRKHIQGIQHIGVSVPDMDLARKFYIDLLGAKEIAGFEWHAGNAFIDAMVGLENSAAKQLLVQLGNTHIEIFEYSAPRADPQDPDEGVNRFGYTHICLQVDDIRTVHRRMLEAGIRFHAAPDYSTVTVDADGQKHGYCATYARDYFGNVFELLEIHKNDDLPPIPIRETAEI